MYLAHFNSDYPYFKFSVATWLVATMWARGDLYSFFQIRDSINLRVWSTPSDLGSDYLGL